jgi:excisionase family DNA binding protein
MSEEARWLTMRQAAERAQVSEATIRREIKARRMTAARIGGRRSWRLRPEWVDEWLQASAQPAIQPSVSWHGPVHGSPRPREAATREQP